MRLATLVAEVLEERRREGRGFSQKKKIPIKLIKLI
jgi:hypothetical protein